MHHIDYKLSVRPYRAYQLPLYSGSIGITLFRLVFSFLDACMRLVGPDDNIHYFVCPIAACTSALNPSSSILR
jgi:hypothetical protein